LLHVLTRNCIFGPEFGTLETNLMTEERRSDERVSLNLPARWDGLSGGHEARIEDLSLGGCFVNTGGRVDVGEIVGLEIKLPLGEWLPLRGEVISYQQGIGFGVVFPFLTSDEEQALRELVP
jgi:PilZ domain-containing protein